MNLVSILVFITTLATTNATAATFYDVTPDISLDKEKKKRRFITEYALSFIGTAYNSKRYSKSGFDCSGFVQHVYKQHGVTLSRSSKAMSIEGKRKKRPEKGDLAFFKNNSKVNHVGIVLKVDNDGIHVIHATSSKGIVVTCIEESEYWNKKFAFTRDVL